MIEISNLSKSFPSPEGEEMVHVFSGVDLVVEEGSSVAIVGPSGSGKSTLLNIVGLLDKPTDGKLIVAHKNLNKLKETEVSEYRNQTVGFVFHTSSASSCTVLENVMPQTGGLVKSYRRIKRAATNFGRSWLGACMSHLRTDFRWGEAEGGGGSFINQSTICA